MIGLHPDPPFETIYASAQQGLLAEGYARTSEQSVAIRGGLYDVMGPVVNPLYRGGDDYLRGVRLPEGVQAGAPISYKVAVGVRAQGRIARANYGSGTTDGYELSLVTQAMGVAIVDSHVMTEEGGGRTLLVARRTLYAPRLPRGAGGLALGLLVPQQRLDDRVYNRVLDVAKAVEGEPLEEVRDE
jgi:hypothetical protein